MPTGPDTWLPATSWPACRASLFPVKNPAVSEPRPFSALPRPTNVAWVKSFITPAATIGADQVERLICRPVSAEYGATPKCGDVLLSVTCFVSCLPLRSITTATFLPACAPVVSLSFSGLSIAVPFTDIMRSSAFRPALLAGEFSITRSILTSPLFSTCLTIFVSLATVN